MKFVWPKGLRDEKNISVAFRLKNPLPKGKYRIEIFAANMYRLMVNGALRHFGPGRAAHFCHRREILDLDLGEACNYITAEVVGYNVTSYYCANDLPLFCVRVATAGGEIVAETDGFDCFLLSDRVREVQRFSAQRTFVEYYKMNKCRSEFYTGGGRFEKLQTEEVPHGTLIERHAPYPCLDRQDLFPLIESGAVEKDISRPLWQDFSINNVGKLFPGYKKNELVSCISDELSVLRYQPASGATAPQPALEKNSYLIFDTGRSLTGFLNLCLTVKADCVVYLVFDELDWKEQDNPKYKDGINLFFGRNASCNAVKYELKRGEYNLLTFEPYSARYINIICIRGKFDINYADFVKYENSDAFNRKPIGYDADANLIYQAAQNTFAQNCVDILMDCPSRERAGWLCDSYFSGKAEYFLTGKNLVEKSFLENYYMSPQLKELPEGMIPMCYPADSPCGAFIVNWAMWYVLELYEYFNRTEDRPLIEKSKSKVYGIIKYFANYISPEGFLENPGNWWSQVEWSKANDYTVGINFPTNMLYADMLQKAGELYSDKTLAPQADTLKQKIREHSYNGEFFEDNMLRNAEKRLAKTGNISETCQYYAFFCGIADKKSYPKLFKKMFSDNIFGSKRDATNVYPNIVKSSVLVGLFLRLDILKNNEREGQAATECKDIFLEMAKRTGTLWEHDNASNGSVNHGFTSLAAYYLLPNAKK